ncbi:MAG: purine-nucleoside phosphorylase [Sulfurospirillum sp.]|nr:purine-nucleoside phosphorylase [Sulfurospirillum sp.]MBL0703072.1 purine-nucleoside phosphorylase [Sulfurospirillum sp.]
MIVCAGRDEIFDFAYPIGVGLIESTMNLTRLALFDKPDFLLFIGSAGSYGKHKIFDIISSKTASNIELCFLNNKCYTPLENIISAETDKDVPRETLNIVNSSNYITTDSVSSKEFLTLGLGLENMEFYALLSVAKEYNIPVAGIFIVTNYCNTNAHKDFLHNHKKAKQLLTDYIRSYRGKK